MKHVTNVTYVTNIVFSSSRILQIVLYFQLMNEYFFNFLQEEEAPQNIT